MTLGFRSVTALLITCLSLAGCITGRVIIQHDDAETRLRPVRVRSMTYPRTTPLVEEFKESEDKRYRVHVVSMESIGDDGQKDHRVLAEYHESKAPGRHAVVVVLPIYGSKHRFPEDLLVGRLMSQTTGTINILRVLSHEAVLNWALLGESEDERAFRRDAADFRDRVIANAVDVRQLLDWLQGQSSADMHNVGLVGMSVGGL